MEKVARIDPSELKLPALRERATRYEPTRTDAFLTWRDSRIGDESGTFETEASTPPESQAMFALLLDISQTGAAVAFDRVPRSGENVWLRIEGEGITDWTLAEVVGVITSERGPHLVRLAFRSPCSFETLQAAICG